jgi:hypothetical protein
MPIVAANARAGGDIQDENSLFVLDENSLKIWEGSTGPVGAASAVGSQVLGATASAAGTGASSVIGAEIAAATAASAGTGGSAVTGAKIAAATASAAGTGTSSVTGAEIAAASASAAGVGSSSIVGSTGPVSATAAATGTGAASASGAAIVAATATATGTGASSVAGAEIAAATASAAGTGASAVAGTGIFASTAAATGIGAASGTGAQLTAATANAAGIGAAIANGTIPAFSYLRPDADDTTGGWLNETNGTPLYPSVDEAAPASDADLIHSSNNPTADICRFRLSNPGAVLAPPGKLRIRYRREGTGGVVNLTIRLKQGTTQIGAWTFNDIPSTFTTTAQALTTGEYASITDFNDLFVELQADAA